MELEQAMKQQTEMIRKMFGEGDAKRDASLDVPEGIQAFYDILYDENNFLDIYYPVETQKFLPVIVNVHGGAYVYGTKDVYKYYGMFMAQQGFVFVNASYQLAPEKKFPTQLEDICHVLQWMTDNFAQYYIDIDNVFLVGDSAGAQMASQLGTIYANPSYAAQFSFRIPKEIKIRAMSLNCGMYDLLAISKEPWNKEEEFMDDYVLMEIYLGKEGRLNEERLNVVKNIDKRYPPCFIMTAYYDFLKDCARPFYELLCSKGIEAEFRIYGEKGQEYMGHVFHCDMNLEEARQCNIDECNFMKKYVVSK